MHHQLQQEIRTALQRACTQDPVKITSDIERLRSLDLQREIPVFEFQRLECIAAARTGRYKDATGIILGLPVGVDQMLLAMAKCPEHDRGDFRSFIANTRSALEAKRAKESKSARKAHVKPTSSAAPGLNRSLRSSLLTATIVIGLVGLISAASLLVWFKFIKPPAIDGEVTAESQGREAVATAVEFPDDEIGNIERHVARVVLEIRIKTADDEIRWMPAGYGTAFPVEKGLYLTNRHVVELEDSNRASLAAVFEKFLGAPVKVLDERITLVGSFGYGVLKEVPAEIKFIGVNRNDDLALLKVDDSLGHRCGFAKVPPRRSRVYAVGFPGVSEDLANMLDDVDRSIDRYKRLLGEQKDEDGSLDLVRFFGPRNLEPTTNDGIVSKAELSDGVLQTNAVIAHGSSGGPLLDERGRVIGMNTWGSGGLTSEGFGASIRSDRISRILAASSYHSRIDWGDVSDEED